MSKPSSKTIQGLLRLHYKYDHHHHRLHAPSPVPSNPTFHSSRPCSPSSSSSSVSRSFVSSPSARFDLATRFGGLGSKSGPSSCSASCSSEFRLNCGGARRYFSSRSTEGGNAGSNFGKKVLEKPAMLKLGEFRLCNGGIRRFSIRSSEGGNGGGDFAKKVFEKPATSAVAAFNRYREAIGLQVESFLRSNYLFLLGAGGVLVCVLLWRIMFAVANTFVGISEGMAKYGFLALSSAIVAFAGLYVRSRFTINPDRVYRMAMRKLNTHAGILEVMGAPLAGTDLRAYVMSGGGMTLKKFKPRLRGKRCFLIFPIRGSERKGLVSVEVKKKKGQYNMKLLAVDIPMSTGPDQRLFLIGDEEEYKIGGGLISELRDPVLRAMAATKEFDDLDEIEEEEDAERELQEAEEKHRQEIEKLEKAGRE